MSDYRTEVTRERLKQLLAIGCETDEIDYKEAVDLADREAQVELAKDIGAFSARGGHIIVGACDDGSPSVRFSQDLALKFDAADLKNKMSRYLPAPLGIEVGRHEIDGKYYVVIYVAIAKDGFKIFRADGVYEKSGGQRRQKITFRKGDVFVRNGTSSEKWQQHNAREAIERIIGFRKNEWLASHREELGQIARGYASSELATGPSTSLTWTLDSDVFENILIEQIRVRDYVPISLLLERLPPETIRVLCLESDANDTLVILDKITTLGAVALRLDHIELFDKSIATLASVYNRVFVAGKTVLPRERVWLEIVLRSLALGGLAVRKRRWHAVKTIANQKIDARGQLRRWIRHASVECSRRKMLLGSEESPRLIRRVFEYAHQKPWLRRDEPSNDERFLDSLVHFDVLASASIASETGAVHGGRLEWWPHFAFFFPERVVPAVEKLIVDDGARSVLSDENASDKALAYIIRTLDHMAYRASDLWLGWHSRIIEQFLTTHPD